MEQRRAGGSPASPRKPDPGPLPQDRKYPVILADPPWRYQHDAFGCWVHDVEEHYPTMELRGHLRVAGDPSPLPRDATALPRGSRCRFSNRRSTSSEHGVSIIGPDSSGSSSRHGTGQYLRQRHEHLLIARRGEFPTPEASQSPRFSAIVAPRRGHSHKPDEAYVLIERMYPDAAEDRAFRPSRARGWDSWGNEASPTVETAGMNPANVLANRRLARELRVGGCWASLHLHGRQVSRRQDRRGLPLNHKKQLGRPTPARATPPSRSPIAVQHPGRRRQVTPAARLCRDDFPGNASGPLGAALDLIAQQRRDDHERHDDDALRRLIGRH